MYCNCGKICLLNFGSHIRGFTIGNPFYLALLAIRFDPSLPLARVSITPMVMLAYVLRHQIFGKVRALLLEICPTSQLYLHVIDHIFHCDSLSSINYYSKALCFYLLLMVVFIISIFDKVHRSDRLMEYGRAQR